METKMDASGDVHLNFKTMKVEIFFFTAEMSFQNLLIFDLGFSTLSSVEKEKETNINEGSVPNSRSR